MFSDGTTTTRSVAENTASGQNIGAAITATDADNDTLTYTLSGTDAAVFSIVSTTGQLQTKAALDYETKSTYAVTIAVADGNGGSASITVTINITDVNENRAPVFSDGTTTKRTVALPAGIPAGDYDIGAPIIVTDPDGDTMTHTLGGPNADLFHTYASRTANGAYSLQLTTRGKALHDGTGTTYSVIVSVSDTSGASSRITVTINVTDVNGNTNTAPTFTDGTRTTRSIAENTAAGIHIGTAITATDVDNDTLTYTLSGTDAAAFEIDATTGQLKTKAALDYETKTTYTVTVTASDGSLTDTITVTINITDVNELPASTGVCKVGDVLKPGESCTYPGTDAVFSVLGDGTAQWHIPNLPAWLEWINQTAVSGSLRVSTTVNGQAYHFVAEQVGTSWEIKEIGDDRSDPQPETPEQPEGTPPDDGTPTLAVSTAAPLTEATLHEGIVTLTLSGGTYEQSTWKLRNAVSVAGITGIALDTFDTERISDAKMTVKLEFDGNINTDSTLTLTLGAGAIADYNGAALTAQLPVSAVSELITTSTAAPLTEATLDESVVTLTLRGRKFERWNSTIRPAVSVSGISGVTVRSFDIDRESDTEVTVELTFNGDITTDGILTFTVGADAIAGYNGPALTAQVAVSASEEPIVIDDQDPDPPVEDTPAPTPDTRIAFEANTPAGYTRVALKNTGRVWGIPTKYTTDSDVGTVAYMALAKLMGCNFADAEVARRSVVYIKRQSLGELSGFVSETVCGKSSNAWSTDWNGVQITHLRFFDETSLPNIKEAVYNAATDQIEIPGVWQQPPNNTTKAAPVFTDGTSTTRTIAENTTAGQHIGTAIAATDADNDTLTYTLSGTDAAAFGIDATTGQLKTKAALDYETKNTYTVTITVSDGSLTDTITVTINVTDINEKVGDDTTPQPETPEQPGSTGGTPTLSVSTTAPLTEATLHEGIVTLTLSGGTYEGSIWRLKDAVSVAGITGIALGTFDTERISDTKMTVKLEFEGNINTDSTLTFTLGTGAIADYNGAALTAQLPVSAVSESITTSTAAPLTEAIPSMKVLSRSH